MIFSHWPIFFSLWISFLTKKNSLIISNKTQIRKQGKQDYIDKDTHTLITSNKENKDKYNVMKRGKGNDTHSLITSKKIQIQIEGHEKAKKKLFTD